MHVVQLMVLMGKNFEEVKLNVSHQNQEDLGNPEEVEVVVSVVGMVVVIAMVVVVIAMGEEVTVVREAAMVEVREVAMVEAPEAAMVEDVKTVVVMDMREETITEVVVMIVEVRTKAGIRVEMEVVEMEVVVEDLEDVINSSNQTCFR